MVGLLVEGHTNREIAEKMGLSVKTAESYRSRLFQKLGLRTRAELIRFMRDSCAVPFDNPSSDA